MKRIPQLLALFVGVLLFVGADGCSSDPNVEGAKLDLKNKDYDRAIENLNTALEKNPDNVDALSMKGNALLEKAFTINEVDQHTALIEEMAAAYSRAGELGADVANDWTYAYQKEFERGVQTFNKGQDDPSMYTDAAKYFESTSKIRPDSAGPYVYQGYALLQADRQSEAIVALEKGIERGETGLQTYLYLGELYRAADRPTDSVTLLEKAAEHHGGDADLQAHLLNSYQTAGMMDRAMDKYKASIESDPENKTYRYNYGSLLLQAEMYDESIVHLKKATELDADYANAWYNLGAAYQNKAVGANKMITELDDNLRANRSSLSSEDVRAAEAKIEELANDRKGYFESAVVPLENAKSLTEAEGGDTNGICVALYTAYVQTDRLEDAEGVSSCAGFDD